MQLIHWTLLISGLSISFFLYIIFVARQTFDGNLNLFKQGYDDRQVMRFFALFVFSVFYWILLCTASGSFEYAYEHEIFALSTIIVFTIALFIGEEIGIMQVNHSLYIPLPKETDEERDEKIYYKENFT